MLPVLLMLSGIGLISMIALRDPLRDTLTASAFAKGIAGGLVLLLAASEVDFEASPLRRAVLAPLGLALGLAALLLVLGTGPGTSGVKVNLFGVQPVEAIRLLVVFALAAYFARRLDFLRELSEAPTATPPWLRGVRIPRWKDVRPVVVSMALVLAFFFLQKDLGPALVLSCVVMALYAIARGRVAFVFAGFGLLFARLRRRVSGSGIRRPSASGSRFGWTPGTTASPGGNQIAHGLWALATGSIWGSGPGLGSPQSIPAGHTDFVLAAVGEELGFVGVAVVVGLYAILSWRCLPCRGTRTRGLHGISGCRRRARARRPGLRDRAAACSGCFLWPVLSPRFSATGARRCLPTASLSASCSPWRGGAGRFAGTCIALCARWLPCSRSSAVRFSPGPGGSRSCGRTRSRRRPA